MADINLRCNLELLSKYSFSAELHNRIKVHKFCKGTYTNVSFDFENSTSTMVFRLMKSYLSALRKEYFKGREDLLKAHSRNIFFILYELQEELVNQAGEANDSAEAYSILAFLKGLAEIKDKGTLNYSIEVKVASKTKARLTFSNSGDILNSDRVLKQLMEYIVKTRLFNPVIFETLNVENLSSEGIQNAIHKITPQIVTGSRFQIAHFARVLGSYLNDEVEKSKRPAKPSFLEYFRGIHLPV